MTVLPRPTGDRLRGDLSGYFEERRSAYYEGLLAVSRDDDWSGWCVLFLNAVRSQAASNLAKAQGILDLYEEMVPYRREPRIACFAVCWKRAF